MPGWKWIISILILQCISSLLHAGKIVRIQADTSIPQINFACKNLKHEFDIKKTELVFSSSSNMADILVAIDTSEKSLVPNGFQIRNDQNKLSIKGKDVTGAMYGMLEIMDEIRLNHSLNKIKPRTINPRLAIRAIKFNLPWSSYRSGPVMSLHTETCKDLAFWQSFIDRMAMNRFNLLSLWNVHPFSFMVKSKDFPLANHFTDDEMKEWHRLFSSIFRMCRDRGIEPFIVNWNIAVSTEFAEAYHVRERNDTSTIVREYTRSITTQVIHEYPDLAGIGITLADWMSNFNNDPSPLPAMTPRDREEWISQTIIQGIKDANRPVKLLHRSVLSSDPNEMRKILDLANLPDTTLVEVKFNWSHGHSTPHLAITHDSHSGQKDDGYWNPMPKNYRIEWMIRNEDFFILRWVQTDFIRKHIAQNMAPYVNGYFVGSEGYIPAKDYSHMPNHHVNWAYAFQKKWMYYKAWGRLLYDPETPDDVIALDDSDQQDLIANKKIFSALNLASKMPLRLASYFASTWDYSLYSEGFLAPYSGNSGLYDSISAFISLKELIDHPTLDTDYVSIEDYVNNHYSKNKITPVALSYQLNADAKTAIQQTHSFERKSPCEANDILTWSYLSLYFSEKLLAGIEVRKYQSDPTRLHKSLALSHLENCLKYWDKVSKITSSHYIEAPYIDHFKNMKSGTNDAEFFSWKKFTAEVIRDIEWVKSL